MGQKWWGLVLMERQLNVSTVRNTSAATN